MITITSEIHSQTPLDVCLISMLIQSTLLHQLAQKLFANVTFFSFIPWMLDPIILKCFSYRFIFQDHGFLYYISTVDSVLYF